MCFKCKVYNRIFLQLQDPVSRVGFCPVTASGLVAGRYLLQRRLGRGGAKDVWLAHDLTLDRAVALARVSGPSAWERLRHEALRPIYRAQVLARYRRHLKEATR